MKHKDTTLNVAKVMEDFQRAEQSPTHRKDAFKIYGSFDDALKKIAKPKPHPSK